MLGSYSVKGNNEISFGSSMKPAVVWNISLIVDKVSSNCCRVVFFLQFISDSFFKNRVSFDPGYYHRFVIISNVIIIFENSISMCVSLEIICNFESLSIPLLLSVNMK